MQYIVSLLHRYFLWGYKLYDIKKKNTVDAALEFSCLVREEDFAKLMGRRGGTHIMVLEG